MKRVVILLSIVMCLFVFVTVDVKAYSVSDYFEIAKKSKSITTKEAKDLLKNDDEDAYQSCEGSDSVLGDPKDENSVAWLLDQILTYSTIIAMLLIIVLSSIDFATVIVKSDEEAMVKAGKKFGYRLIFAILLFFVPTITNAILDLFGLTSQSTCGIQQ